jgi:hypothetical protein
MGVDGSSKSFSTDILRIKIFAEDVPNLTLVDLPGFYHSEDDGQSAQGREVVNKLVHNYMTQKNSIILAVVSAKNEIVMQKVLTEAKKPDIDPRRVRTLGVITQPDRLEPGSSDESKFLQLANNMEQSHILKHEWHVLRNRAEAEIDSTDEERDAKEAEFLESGSWGDLPSKNKGAAKLREKLSMVLFNHIATSLPRVVSDMEKSIAERREQLAKLGDPRSDVKSMQVYLEKIASKFSNLARNAVEGNYMNTAFFGDFYTDPGSDDVARTRVTKLRAWVRDMNQAFVAVMYSKGSKRSIQWQDGAPLNDMTTGAIPDHISTLINDNYEIPDPTPVSEEELKELFRRRAAENKGCEFPGEPNFRVTLQQFQEQSSPWKQIAAQHIDLVMRTAQDFVVDLFEHVVDTDADTRERILRDCVDPFFSERREILKAKLEELLPQYEKIGFALPLEYEFEARSKKRTLIRLNKQVEDLEKRDHNPLVGKRREVILDNQVYTQAYIDDRSGESRFAVEKMIDNMVAYYEVSH